MFCTCTSCSEVVVWSPITTLKLLKNLRSVRVNSYKEIFLHLYGCMVLSGSIESDNHNGAIEKVEKRSDK